jgi:mannose-1-phosphate guanylyltransferase
MFSACPSDSIDYAVMEKTDKGIIMMLVGTPVLCLEK